MRETKKRKREETCCVKKRTKKIRRRKEAKNKHTRKVTHKTQQCQVKTSIFPTPRKEAWQTSTLYSLPAGKPNPVPTQARMFLLSQEKLTTFRPSPRPWHVASFNYI